jgi:hypothetical protein
MTFPLYGKIIHMFQSPPTSIITIILPLLLVYTLLTTINHHYWPDPHCRSEKSCRWNPKKTLKGRSLGADLAPKKPHLDERSGVSLDDFRKTMCEYVWMFRCISMTYHDNPWHSMTFLDIPWHSMTLRQIILRIFSNIGSPKNLPPRGSVNLGQGPETRPFPFPECYLNGANFFYLIPFFLYDVPSLKLWRSSDVE